MFCFWTHTPGWRWGSCRVVWLWEAGHQIAPSLQAALARPVIIVVILYYYCCPPCDYSFNIFRSCTSNCTVAPGGTRPPCNYCYPLVLLLLSSIFLIIIIHHLIASSQLSTMYIIHIDTNRHRHRHRHTWRPFFPNAISGGAVMRRTPPTSEKKRGEN